MCTLSWKPLNNGYVLFFNRDESRDRAVARGPSLQQNDGVEFLSPTDGARGGTWLLVNAHGISVALLNNYASTQSVKKVNPGLSSRGMLPLECSDCVSVAEAITRIETMPLEHYPPFHLLVAGADEASVLTWNGDACFSETLDASGAMLTTSAFRSKTVAKTRRETFVTLVGDMNDATPSQLRDFHWYEGDDGATGIRMSRPDACTHSISRITVSMDEAVVSFQYSPQADILVAGKSAKQSGLQLPASSLRMMLQ